MGRLFNHLVRYAAGTSITDTQCGAKVFRAPVARLAFSRLLVDGFAFDVEVLRRIVGLGFAVVEHPVSWRYVPGTKIRPTTPFVMLGDILRLRLSRSVEALACVDAPMGAPVRALATSLGAHAMVDDGQPCRILVPDWDDGPTADDIIDELATHGVKATMGQSRTWLQPNGWSPS